ncbi:A/G-specific adenine glycosylase [Candidatus Woesearchaeota archaeon]|nr:A/G-specific adenine glycosylase [Candidatus Woesearchaeota archaeon]
MADFPARFESTLLSWYSLAKRDLPWRKTTDPYKILVSEVMLQQTQVDRVIPKYGAFLHAFPTVQALADAPTGDVIRLWSGLGYNRRAVKLQECARAVAESHGGKFPQSVDGLKQLPGIGPYTAAAVMAFAFNKPEVVVDTNVRRVFFRLGIGSEREGLSEDLQGLIAGNVSQKCSRDYHNALMDFGATVCTARAPKCESCVFNKQCVSVKKYTKQQMEDVASRIFKTTQSKFEGSNRYYRSMILKEVQRKQGQLVEELAKVLSMQKTLSEQAPLPAVAQARSLVRQLEKDKLIAEKNGRVYLP